MSENYGIEESRTNRGLWNIILSIALIFALDDACDSRKALERANGFHGEYAETCINSIYQACALCRSDAMSPIKITGGRAP